MQRNPCHNIVKMLIYKRNGEKKIQENILMTSGKEKFKTKSTNSKEKH